MTIAATEIKSGTIEAEHIKEFPDPTNPPPTHRHIVNKAQNIHLKFMFRDWDSVTGADIVSLARMGGYRISALCRYTWIPSKANAETNGLPTCDKCVELASLIQYED